MLSQLQPPFVQGKGNFFKILEMARSKAKFHSTPEESAIQTNIW